MSAYAPARMSNDDDSNGSDVPGGTGVPEDESVEELTAKVAELSDELEEVKTHPRGRWRRFLVAVLLVVATLLAVVSNLIVWLERTVLDTDTYISTIEPLPEDPAISEALATFLVDELYSDVDIDTTIEDALPEEAGFLAGPLETGVKTFSVEAAAQLIQSDQFVTIWVEANRSAHSLAVQVIEGGGDAVSTSGGKVTVNLQPAVMALADELGAGDQLGSLVDTLNLGDNVGTFVLFEDEQLGELQLAVEWLRRLRFVLPLLMLACYVAAVWLSPRRRRTIIGVGVSLIVAMLATRLVLDLVREWLLDLPEKKLGRNALESFFDILVRGLDAQTQMLLFLGIVLVIGGAVMGPYKWAVGLRRFLAGALMSAGDRVEEQPPWLDKVSSVIEPRRTAFMGGGVVAALVILWLWDLPTGRVVISLSVLLLVYLGIVQFLAVLSGHVDSGEDDEPDQASPGSRTTASPAGSTSTNRS